MPPHPLLDLFPPPPIRDRERAPGPARSGAPPPSVARPRSEPAAEAPEAQPGFRKAPSAAREVPLPDGPLHAVGETTADLDPVSVQSDARSRARTAVTVLVLTASLLAGAGAAAWVFRSDVSRVLAHWRR
jgi:hypothetical protein